ncbi:MAG TPA: response regulator, partial [Planctomycetota bacterium]|nr:response regulator [Planctomycetota bacterium]
MGRRPSILIVDDHPANIAILEEMLAETYRVMSVSSGTEALEVLGEFRPDLILLDIMMPGIDGYEVCRRVRANPEYRHTKILMLSAKALLEERLAGYGAGADDYVTKPFDEDELMQKIRVFLRLKAEEEVEQLKDDLLSLLHDSERTPFRSLIVPAESLATPGEMPDDLRRRYGALISHNATLVREFFDQVLEICALRTGEGRLDPTETTLGTVLRDAAGAAGARGTSRGVTIEQKGESPPLRADATRLERACVEILGFAVDASEDNVPVQVDVKATEAAAEARVACRSSALSPASAAHLFSIPRRESSAADDDLVSARSRLGLALAGETVRA